MFKVTKTALVKLFVSLGFPTATKWDVSRLKKKVEGLPDVIDEDTDAGDSQDLLDNLLIALDNEDGISVQDEDDVVKDEDDVVKDEDDVVKETFTAGPEVGRDIVVETETKKKKKKKKVANHLPPEGEPKDNGKPKKVGVIASIVEFLSASDEKKPMTKETLLGKLEKRFPDRESKSMISTIATQVPSRLKLSKGIICSKNNEGGWWID